MSIEPAEPRQPVGRGLRAICIRPSTLRNSSNLIAQKHLAPSQEPDVTRILPSGGRSMTIVLFSVVAKRSRTFFERVCFQTKMLRAWMRLGGCFFARPPLASVSHASLFAAAHFV